jgi:hypothetical protein
MGGFAHEVMKHRKQMRMLRRPPGEILLSSKASHVRVLASENISVEKADTTASHTTTGSHPEAMRSIKGKGVNFSFVWVSDISNFWYAGCYSTTPNWCG